MPLPHFSGAAHPPAQRCPLGQLIQLSIDSPSPLICCQYVPETQLWQKAIVGDDDGILEGCELEGCDEGSDVGQLEEGIEVLGSPVGIDDDGTDEEGILVDGIPVGGPLVGADDDGTLVG